LMVTALPRWPKMLWLCDVEKWIVGFVSLNTTVGKSSEAKTGEN